MNKIFPTCILIVMFAKIATAQSARVTVIIANAKDFSGYISVYNPTAKFDIKTRGATFIPLNSSHAGSCTLHITQPQFVILNSDYSIVKDKQADKFFSYVLFVTPGDDLILAIDPNKSENILTVTGRGSNNNQPAIFALTAANIGRFKRDTLPDRVLAAINKQNQLNKATLTRYIIKYNPSKAFVKNALLNLTYFPPAIYCEFNHERNLLAPKAGLVKWQNAQDSLLSTIMLNNDKALTCYNYTHFVTEFLDAEKKTLWFEQDEHPPLFFKKLYHHTLFKHQKLIYTERDGIGEENTIRKYFRGKTAEYLYVELLKEKLYTKNYNNINLIFSHFKRKYPESTYITDFNNAVTKIADNQKHKKTGETVF